MPDYDPTEPDPRDDETPITWVAVTATCHTEGCGNAEIGIPLLTPEGGLVVCGVCSQPITDVVQREPRPDEIPTPN